MTTLEKVIMALLAVVVFGAIYGGYLFPQIAPPLGSAVGATFNSAKIAAVNISPLTSTATSTSILNTDGSARYVQTGFTDCTGAASSFTYLTGAGIANLIVHAATSSTAIQNANTNYALSLNVATSTGWSNSASSTPNGVLAYWPSGTYLTFTFNATNTAACTVGVYYIAS